MAYVTAEEALSVVQSGQRVFVHGSACTPIFMLHKLAEQAPRLRDVELVSISMYGEVEVEKPEYAESFHINSQFVSDSIRKAVNDGRADYIPVFLSEIPVLFKQRILPLDAQTMLLWGSLIAQMENAGRPMSLMDSLIMATALQNNLIIATRNLSDFLPSGAQTINPWE